MGVMKLVAAVYWLYRKSVFTAYHGGARLLLSGFRLIYSYQTIAKALLTGTVMGILVYFFAPKTTVLATVFYATILFVVNLFQGDQPFPIVSSTQQYFDAEYAEQDDEYGFEYEFTLLNNGTKELLAPRIEYAVYDSNYQRLQGWNPVPGTTRGSVRLSPSSDPISLSFEESGTSETAEIDFFVAVRALPRRGSWILGSWWTEEIHQQPSKDPTTCEKE